MASKRDRSRGSLGRMQGKRSEYPRILVVCEGAKTEPLYFNGLRQKLRLPTVDCMIVPSDWGPPPDKVVGYAEHLVKADTWDEAWCVFDRDEHPYYLNALDAAKRLDGKLRNADHKTVMFKAIASDPCFELWFLIHFEQWTKEAHRDTVRHRLEVHVPEYQKALGDMWKRLESKLHDAISQAVVLRQRRDATGNANPSTEVDRLVVRLMDLKKGERA